MSFNIDVNPDAPIELLSALTSSVRANCPKTVTDADGVWKASTVWTVTRNNKTALECRYSGPNSAISRKWIYYSKPMIGVHDYTELFAGTNFPFFEIASTETNLLGFNQGYLTTCLTEFGFSPQSSQVGVSAFDAFSWNFFARIDPLDTHEISPGVKKYSANWIVKFTDVDSNVASGPTPTVDGVTIAPSYGVFDQDSPGTFQDDFRNGMGSIGDAISNFDINTPLTSLGNLLKTALESAVSTGVGLVTTVIGAITGGEGNPPVTQKIDDLGQSVTNAGNHLAGAIHSSLETNVKVPLDAIRLQLETCCQEMQTLITAKADLAIADLDKLGKLEAIEIAVNNHRLAMKWDDTLIWLRGVSDALHETGTLRRITDVLAARPDYSTKLGEVVEKMEAIKTTLKDFDDDLERLMPGGSDLSAEESAALQPYIEGLVLSSGAPPSVLTWLPAVALKKVIAGADKIAIIVRVIHDIVDTMNNLKQLTSDGKTDIKGDALDLFTKLEADVKNGLHSPTEAYLKSLRDSIGWKAPPDENTFDESIRGALIGQSGLLNALYVVNGETGEKLSVAAILLDAGCVVQWGEGDMLFQYP